MGLSTFKSVYYSDPILEIQTQRLLPEKSKRMKNNLFTQETASLIIDRINLINTDTKANWGKMNAAQMLAHCNVTYEMVYDNKHPKPNAILKFILKTLVKSKVVSEKPYPKNGQTAPQFLIKEDKNFKDEKQRLLDYIEKTKDLGAAHFDGKESHSFGALNIQEWNNMFYKHLDHHLNQFGV